jgi:hypothetical protein
LVAAAPGNHLFDDASVPEAVAETAPMPSRKGSASSRTAVSTCDERQDEVEDVREARDAVAEATSIATTITEQVIARSAVLK